MSGAEPRDVTGHSALDGFCNLTGRPRGHLLTLAGLVLPGIRAVQAQTEPYARRWRRANRAAVAGTGPLWVALGDSMSQGLGAPAHDRGWVGQLGERLAAAGSPHRLVNLSMTGARVPDVLERQLPVLERLQPDLVTVLIGSNDVLGRAHRARLPHVLPQLLGRLPAGTVIGNQPGGHPAALQINAMIDEAVARYGLVLAELRDPRMRSWSGKLSADRFHPNELGYASMAEIFAEAVTGSLRRRPGAPGG